MLFAAAKVEGVCEIFVSILSERDAFFFVLCEIFVSLLSERDAFFFVLRDLWVDLLLLLVFLLSEKDTFCFCTLCCLVRSSDLL